jgi:hypothetical protein
MKKTLINIVAEGIGIIADSYTTHRQYVHPAQHGFSQDWDRLRGDVRMVGCDLSQAITKYGQQSNQPPRSKQ